MKISKLIFIITVFFSSIQNSQASPVTFIVEGNLDYVDTALSGSFSIGDLFHLEYTFDPMTIDSNPANSNRGFYDDSISSLNAVVGGYNATGNGAERISVDNDLVGADQYRIDITTPMTGDSINGYNLSTQTPILQLRDTTETAFSSDSLITYALNPADFLDSGTFLALEFVDPDYDDIFNPTGGLALISANITSFEVSNVPVPAAFWLLLSGLTTLIGFSRRKQEQ